MSRSISLETGRYYHVYNRGVDKREMFLDSSYYRHFLTIFKHYLQFDYPYSTYAGRLERAKTVLSREKIRSGIEKYRIESPVEIISFVLMPNHYHFLFRQPVEGGISFLMHKLGLSYTHYFNRRSERSGRLFEDTYKVAEVRSIPHLIYLTAYHHRNPLDLPGVVTAADLISYPWSSFGDYIGKKRFDWLNTDPVLGEFESGEQYRDYVLGIEDPDEAQPVEVDWLID